jgi:hypothetical protein
MPLRLSWAGRAVPLAVLVSTALVLFLASCGGEDGENAGERAMPPPSPKEFPSPKGKTFEELRKELVPGPVLSPSVSVLKPGENRFGFGLFDRARKQIADAPAAIYVAPTSGGKVAGPYPARYESLAVRPQFQSRTVSSDPDAAESLYVAKLPFKKAGSYRAMAVVKLDDRLLAADLAGPALRVARKSPVPSVGDKAISMDTPTTQSVGGDVSKIDTRVPPDTMHDDNFADVLGKKPIVLLFATPALCQSRVCGPVVDVAEQLKSQYGDKAAFIHMEIYNGNELEKGFRPQVRKWGLPTEPWLFTIDTRGRIAAEIEGAFSARELDGAIKAALKG